MTIFRRIGLLPIAIVAGLTLGGAAYAAWSSSLSLSGPVQTGEVQAIWDYVATQQYVNGRELPVPDPAPISCTAEVEVGEPAHLATFLIQGAFPNYICEIVLRAQVTGTIPVGVGPIRTTATNSAGTNVLGRDLEVTTRLVERDSSIKKGGGCLPNNPLPPTTTFPPGDSFCVVVGVQINRAVRVGTSYDVSVTLDLVQWNLVPR